MDMLVKLLVRSLAIWVAAYVVPGVVLTGFVPAIVAAVVLGILNMFVRPLLLILTIPVNILTLGLFTLVINTIIILMASNIVPGFKITSFWTAFWFSIVLSIINMFLDAGD